MQKNKQSANIFETKEIVVAPLPDLKKLQDDVESGCGFIKKMVFLRS